MLVQDFIKLEIMLIVVDVGPLLAFEQILVHIVVKS